MVHWTSQPMSELVVHRLGEERLMMRETTPMRPEAGLVPACCFQSGRENTSSDSIVTHPSQIKTLGPAARPTSGGARRQKEHSFLLAGSSAGNRLSIEAFSKVRDDPSSLISRAMI